MDLNAKLECNRLLITLIRRMMNQLSDFIPILYNKTKNEQIYFEQDTLMQVNNFDVFDVLKTAIEYMNPVIFSILKDETLRVEVTRYAIPTKPDSFRIPLFRVLLLQENKVPHLIAFGSHDSCINDILDVLHIPYENKNMDIIPFNYLTLNYIIVLKNRSYHDIYLKTGDCLINNQPIFYVMMMEFIELTTNILHFSKCSIVHAYPKPNLIGCPHGCNFRSLNSGAPNNSQNPNAQQPSTSAEESYVPEHMRTNFANSLINRRYAELMNMLRAAKNYRRD